VLRQQFFVDARLVVETFGECFRREARKVLITFVVLRQQNQMMISFLA
jgi:hypothetical protein